MTLDWTKPEQKVSQHFSVKETLFLHQWNRLANENDGLNDSVKSNLTNLCAKLDQVRDILNTPINVHCMYRSPDYNKLIGAPEHDVHSMGMACDFDCLPAMTCDEVKEKLLPQLENLNMRMENNGQGASWVHLDIHAVIHSRYFNP